MRSAERNISDYKVIKERQYDVGAVQMRVAGILHRAVFFMEGDCSIVRAPVIAASIRNPGCRPTYSYQLARPMSMTRCMQACASHGRCPELS